MQNGGRAWRAMLLLVLTACSGGGARPESPPCDEKCRDDVGVRAVRETMKLVFNLTLQGKPVGAQDQRIDCPLGGRAHVFGTASSNADQGSTFVSLTYELEECAYTQQDDEPEEAYAVVTSGTLTQEGTLAVQPSSTTALRIEGSALTVRGMIYDPAVPYEIVDCEMLLMQNGNQLAGVLCQRPVGFDL